MLYEVITHEHMQQMMKSAFGDSDWPFETDMDLHMQGQPEVKLVDKGDHYRIEITVPGVAEPQIKTELNGNQLKIVSILEEEHQQDNADKGQYRRSYKTGSFERVISFDEPVVAKSLTSQYEDKTLVLEIKKEKK